MTSDNYQYNYSLTLIPQMSASHVRLVEHFDICISISACICVNDF